MNNPIRNYLSLAEIAERSGVEKSECLSTISRWMLANAEGALANPKYSDSQKEELAHGVGFILSMAARINAIVPGLDPSTAIELLDATSDGLLGASIIAQFCQLSDTAVGIHTSTKLNTGRTKDKDAGKALMRAALDAVGWDEKAKAVRRFRKDNPQIERSNSVLHGWIGELHRERAAASNSYPQS